MINKELFYEEIKNMNLIDRVDKEDLEMLINLVDEKVIVDGVYLADKIINDLFSTFNTEPFIPWGFFETEIGKCILVAKYKLSGDIYFVADVVELTGCSKQYLSKQIRLGNIEAKKRHGAIYFTETSVNKYLRKKGLKTISDTKQVIYQETKEKFIGGYERECIYGEK